MLARLLIEGGEIGAAASQYGTLAAFLVVVGAFLKYLAHRDREHRELTRDVASQMQAAMARSTQQMDSFEKRNAAEHARIVEILASRFAP